VGVWGLSTPNPCNPCTSSPATRHLHQSCRLAAKRPERQLDGRTEYAHQCRRRRSGVTWWLVLTTRLVVGVVAGADEQVTIRVAIGGTEGGARVEHELVVVTHRSPYRSRLYLSVGAFDGSKCATNLSIITPFVKLSNTS
jgi:hypothetical protein